ncbi:MAG: creatininase family protein, partial [Rectinemataceae bacterium]|nr:creatininase family protein [Rectinemataceae bacterium]
PRWAGRKKNAFVVLPIAGGTKEHGYHHPLGTDMYVIDELARIVALESGPEVLMLPTLNYAYFPAFADWPGTVSIGSHNFIAFVGDIVRSYAKHGAKKFLLLDGGVSTQGPLAIVSYDLANELGIRVAVTNISALGGKEKKRVCVEKGGGHGDESETSCILAIRPDLVHIERAVNDKSPELSNMRSDAGAVLITLKGPIKTASGINGEPLAATAEKGRAILDAMGRDVLAFLRSFLDSE